MRRRSVGGGRGGEGTVCDAASYLPPFVHLSMMIAADGIALYAKLQTDPNFDVSTAIAGPFSRAARRLSASAAERGNTGSNNGASRRRGSATGREVFGDDDDDDDDFDDDWGDAPSRRDLRSQLASTLAVVDVARAAYQHPTTVPVLRFAMPFHATAATVAAEGTRHFLALLRAANEAKARASGGVGPGGDGGGDTDDDGADADGDVAAEADSHADDGDNDGDGEDLLPTTRADNLEMYVYHVEDPNAGNERMLLAAHGGAGGAAGKLAGSAGRLGRVGRGGADPVSLGAHNRIGAAAAAASNNAHHRAVQIGDYVNAPPLPRDAPIRTHLDLFPLIAAARRRRRKFIVRSGLPPSAVQPVAPLNVHAVLVVGPLWLERRAMELQEETARGDVARSEARFLQVLREASDVSHARANSRAKGHAQLRAFHGEVEGMFLRLALRDAVVKQASMRVHDVVAAHLARWPAELAEREALYQCELGRRRCALVEAQQQRKLAERIALM